MTLADRTPDHIPEPSELVIFTQEELEDAIEKHKMYLKGQRGGARAVIKYRNLSGLDFNQCDLSHADFTGSALISANLSHCKFEAACFFACDLRNSDLRHTGFNRADFRGAYVAGANLTGADLANADMREGKIMHRGKQGELTDRKRSGGIGAKTIFTGARLSDTNMTGAQARSADFSDADMTGVVLQDADLEGASFTGANLTDADFTGSNLTGASMKSSIVSGTILDRIERNGLDMEGAVEERDMGSRLENLGKSLPELLEEHTLWVATVGRSGRQLDLGGYDLRDVLDIKRFPLTAIKAIGANLLNQDLRGASLQSATFDRSDFRDANMEGADLRASTLKYAQLSRANLKDAKLCPLEFTNPDGSKRLQRTDLSGAVMRYSAFENTDLRDCVLMGVDLTNAVFINCDLRRADLTGAILTGTIFENTKLDDAVVDMKAIARTS